MKEIRLPETCLVLLVGASSSGKSTFAKKYFASTEVVSSDYCRGLVSDDENNLDATQEAFEVLRSIAANRLKLGKLTVIDALNLYKADRARLVQLAKDNYALPAAIVFETPIRKLIDRHEGRVDRHFSKHVIERQHDEFKRSLRTIEKEGFSYVYYVNSEEDVHINRQKLWNNKREEHGAFDIIGDIHGCFDELRELLNTLGYQIEATPEGRYQVRSPGSRRLIFLGDLTDRGDKSPEVLRLVMDLVVDGKAFCICGNHDEKLNRFLAGKNVNFSNGFEKTVRQLESTSKDFKKEVKEFLKSLIAHYVFDDGNLVVAHGGLPEVMHGRASAAVRAFCLFGETTGEIDEFGLPVRYNWAQNYKGKAMVVYGHTPVPDIEWLNNTVNIDTGCVFGGKLSALRYPEREIVQVAAKHIYAEPVRPIRPSKEQISAQQELDDMLDIEIINGKKLIETKFHTKVIIREENAVAALEVLSRFAMNPKWLIHLPPTMSPPETSELPDYLEHPEEVFNYYLKNGVTNVICEEKHMGSRAIAIVCKEPDTAVGRFGLLKPSGGTIYTRTGRKFFERQKTETDFLGMIHHGLTESNFWERFETDWVCLDGEIMPWSAKAKDLLIKQYAAVGSAGMMGLTDSIEVLTKAKTRTIRVEHLVEAYAGKKERIQKFIASYRNYCRETDGIEGLMFAPFHILATEGKTHFDMQHPWHLEAIKEFCACNSKNLMLTASILVNLQDRESRTQAIEWWMELTANGGEGMVVKPLEFISSFKGRSVQPAIKCRGSEYLRIIYGPEYDTPENIRVLRERNVRVKRDLATKEFMLGVESLDRFVHREPLRRIHECVFGVLAMESESVDPRL